MTNATAALAKWCEIGLVAAAFLFPPILAVASRGAAPLAGFAGLCAGGLVIVRRPIDWRGLRTPTLLLGLLALWGAASAVWSIDPVRSVALAVRLGGLSAAALALAAAADRIAEPQRVTAALYIGMAVAIGLALTDLFTDSLVRRQFYTRHLGPTQLNQFAATLAILTLPLAALPACRGRPWLAAAAAVIGAGVVATLVDTGAKLGLAAAVPVAIVVFWRRQVAARTAAVLCATVILAAPLVLPRLADIPGAVAAGDAIKSSVGHRLLIWHFVGARIDDRPWLGWGLDSSRAIPGGKVEFRPAQEALPLHPHDAALQVRLELGRPGACLFALIAGWLWWRLAAAAWPRLYTAAAGGALTAAMVLAQEAFGVWQEWWIGALALALFCVKMMGSAASPIQGGRRTRGPD